MWLIDLGDAQLRSGLGLTPEDIAILRGPTNTLSSRLLRTNDPWKRQVAN
jgi:hypothetical protein